MQASKSEHVTHAQIQQEEPLGRCMSERDLGRRLQKQEWARRLQQPELRRSVSARVPQNKAVTRIHSDATSPLQAVQRGITPAMLAPLKQLHKHSDGGSTSLWWCCSFIVVVLAFHCVPRSVGSTQPKSSELPQSHQVGLNLHAFLLGAFQLAICFTFSFYLSEKILNRQGSNIAAFLHSWQLHALIDYLPQSVSLLFCLAGMTCDELGLLPGLWPHEKSRLSIIKALCLVLFLHVLTMAQVVAELWYSTHILRGQKAEIWRNAFERRMLWLLILARTAPEDRQTVEDWIPGALRKPINPLAASNEGSELDQRSAKIGSTTFEQICTELVSVSTGKIGSQLWMLLCSFADSTHHENDGKVKNVRVEENASSGIQAAGKLEVGDGAQVLFRQLVHASGHGGELTKHVLANAVSCPEELEYLWDRLFSIEGPESGFNEGNILKRTNTDVHVSTPQASTEDLPTRATSDILHQPTPAVHEDTFEAFVLATFDEARRLVDFVENHSAIFALFCKSLKFVRFSIFALVLWQAYTPEWLQTAGLVLSSVVFSLSFAFKDTMREALESLVLLLFIRPFDAGDTIVFHGTTLIVVKVRLLNTIFRTPYNEIIYIRNSALYAEANGIMNYRRSGCAAVEVELLLKNEFVQQYYLDALSKCAQSHVAVHRSAWSEEPLAFYNVPTTCQSGGCLVGTETSGPQFLTRWRVFATHRLTKQHGFQVRVDASRLLYALIQEGTRLGISWSPDGSVGKIIEPSASRG